MDTVAESGREERSARVSTRFSLGMDNERGLTWGGTAEPVSRDDHKQKW